MSTALARHRAIFGVDPRIGEAARVVQRLAPRGRGGRNPCRPLQERTEERAALLVGTYYLLRGVELMNLRLNDIGHWHCKGAWQVTTRSWGGSAPAPPQGRQSGAQHTPHGSRFRGGPGTQRPRE